MGRESQNCYFSQMHFEDKRFTEYIKPLVPKCTPKKYSHCAQKPIIIMQNIFFCSCDALLEKCINKKKRAFASSSVKKILKTFVMAHFFTHLENKPGDE